MPLRKVTVSVRMKNPICPHAKILMQEGQVELYNMLSIDEYEPSDFAKKSEKGIDMNIKATYGDRWNDITLKSKISERIRLGTLRTHDNAKVIVTIEE